MTAKIEEIQEYVALYDEVRGRVKSKDEAIAILQEMGKDRRGKDAQLSKSFSKLNVRNENGISTKQLAYAKFLKIDIPQQCTRDQLSDLIDKANGKTLIHEKDA